VEQIARYHLRAAASLLLGAAGVRPPTMALWVTSLMKSGFSLAVAVKSARATEKARVMPSAVSCVPRRMEGVLNENTTSAIERLDRKIDVAWVVSSSAYGIDSRAFMKEALTVAPAALVKVAVAVAVAAKVKGWYQGSLKSIALHGPRRRID